MQSIIGPTPCIYFRDLTYALLSALQSSGLIRCPLKSSLQRCYTLFTVVNWQSKLDFTVATGLSFFINSDKGLRPLFWLGQHNR